MGAFFKQHTGVGCAAITAVNGLCKAKSHIQLGKNLWRAESNAIKFLQINYFSHVNQGMYRVMLLTLGSPSGIYSEADCTAKCFPKGFLSQSLR